jgi:beta-N-acetylhexosaminidase
MKQKIGQRIIIGFEGDTLPKEIIRLDEEWGLGGVILFKRNLIEPEQIFSLNESIMRLGKGTPPFIAIDQEGGRVTRLPEPFTIFPEMVCVGHHGTVSMAYEVGAIVGRELSVSGFNLNFAPVLDLDTNPNNPIIGDRAISDQPEVVATLGRSLIQGLQDNHVVACGKHFPGHGDTDSDTHLGRVECHHDRETLLSSDTFPYRKLAEEDILNMVMLSHVHYPKIDPDHPASLSSEVIQGLLRTEVGFRGVCVSDDLEMKAITDHYSVEEMTHRAFEAGLDIYLMCHTLEKQVEVLETLIKIAEDPRVPKSAWDSPLRRIITVKKNCFNHENYIDRVHAMELIGAREHVRISRRLREDLNKRRNKLAEAEAEAKAQAEARAQAKAEAPAQAKAEATAQAKAEATAQAKAEATAQAKAEAPTQAKAEAPTQAKAEAPAQAKEEDPAQTKTEAPAKEPQSQAETQPDIPVQAQEARAEGPSTESNESES